MNRNSPEQTEVGGVGKQLNITEKDGEEKQRRRKNIDKKNENK